MSTGVIHSLMVNPNCLANTWTAVVLPDPLGPVTNRIGACTPNLFDCTAINQSSSSATFFGCKANSDFMRGAKFSIQFADLKSSWMRGTCGWAVVLLFADVMWTVASRLFSKCVKSKSLKSIESSPRLWNTSRRMDLFGDTWLTRFSSVNADLNHFFFCEQTGEFSRIFYSQTVLNGNIFYLFRDHFGLNTKTVFSV